MAGNDNIKEFKLFSEDLLNEFVSFSQKEEFQKQMEEEEEEIVTPDKIKFEIDKLLDTSDWKSNNKFLDIINNYSKYKEEKEKPEALTRQVLIEKVSKNSWQSVNSYLSSLHTSLDDVIISTFLIAGINSLIHTENTSEKLLTK